MQPQRQDDTFSAVQIAHALQAAPVTLSLKPSSLSTIPCSMQATQRS